MTTVLTVSTILIGVGLLSAVWTLCYSAGLFRPRLRLGVEMEALGSLLQQPKVSAKRPRGRALSDGPVVAAGGTLVQKKTGAFIQS